MVGTKRYIQRAAGSDKSAKTRQQLSQPVKTVAYNECFRRGSQITVSYCSVPVVVNPAAKGTFVTAPTEVNNPVLGSIL